VSGLTPYFVQRTTTGTWEPTYLGVAIAALILAFGWVGICVIIHRAKCGCWPPDWDKTCYGLFFTLSSFGAVVWTYVNFVRTGSNRPEVVLLTGGFLVALVIVVKRVAAYTTALIKCPPSAKPGRKDESRAA